MKGGATRARATSRKNLVGFMVGGVRYAVGVAAVKQVVNPAQTTQLPLSGRVLLGVWDFRGEVIPVVDLRVHFGVPAENTRRTKWIVLDAGQRLVAVVVDAVTGVFGTAEDALQRAPELGTGDEQRSIAAVARHENAMVFVLERGLFAELIRPAMDAGLLEAGA